MLLGLLLGVANAVTAVCALYLVQRLTAPEEAFGWFAYVPLESDVGYDQYAFPWAYVAVPVALVVLNAVLLPLVLRRR